MTRFCLLLFLLLLPCFSRADNAGVLREINLARTHPQEYADLVQTRMDRIPGASAHCIAEAINFLRRQSPLDPLQNASGLEASAREQVEDQGSTGRIGHRGADGGNPWSRMAKAGQWIGRAGENISYGYEDARAIVATLIVDQGVPSKSHRHNIFCRDFKVAGAALGPHARYGAMCVIDFAGGFASKGALAMAGSDQAANYR